MKKISVAIFALICATSFTSYAAGVMQFRGTVHSFDEKNVLIKSKSHIYHIKKSSISPAEINKLKKLSLGKVITLSVPFGGLHKVVPHKKKVLKN